MRVLPKIVAVAAALALAALVAIEVSPWPSALAIRFVFDTGGERVNRALAARVPAGVAARLNEIYDPADPDARLDVFFPSNLEESSKSALTVVWIHGGGFLAGSKEQIANYAKILAAEGYTVAGVDYSVAPEKKFPTPLRQVNTALDYLQRNAARLHVDPNRFVLAGDSAGAQIAAQVANSVTSPAYARALDLPPTLRPAQIVGLLLYCGPYDVKRMATGSISWFARTVLWSYSGRRDFANDPRLPTLAVVDYLTPQFPPSFISVGNADPLAGQSYALAAALTRLGVQVDTLFFSDHHSPPLPHEYQFDLDSEDGRLALTRSREFLASLH